MMDNSLDEEDIYDEMNSEKEEEEEQESEQEQDSEQEHSAEEDENDEDDEKEENTKAGIILQENKQNNVPLKTTAKKTKTTQPKATSSTTINGVSKARQLNIPVMVELAVKNLANRSGCSIIAIKKYILANYEGIDESRLLMWIKKYVKKALSNGRLKNSKGVGIVGSVKLSAEVLTEFKKGEQKKSKSKPQKPKLENTNKNKEKDKKENEKPKTKPKKQTAKIEINTKAVKKKPKPLTESANNDNMPTSSKQMKKSKPTKAPETAAKSDTVKATKLKKQMKRKSIGTLAMQPISSATYKSGKVASKKKPMATKDK